jgi:hypothetical protein
MSKLAAAACAADNVLLRKRDEKQQIAVPTGWALKASGERSGRG